MPSAALVRKIASLLLVVCFVLPLTKCSKKQEAVVAPASAAAPIQAVPMPPIDTYYYPVGIIAADVQAVREGQYEQLPWIVVVLATFFAPFATLWLREPRRSILQLLVALPCLYFLVPTTLMGTPQIGGVLALACWAVLLGLCTVTLWGVVRKKRERR